LTQGFRGFSPWLLGTLAFGPVERQYIMEGSACQSKAIDLLVARKQRETGRHPGPNIPFKGTPPSRPYILKVSSSPSNATG
jgi:hypothetical protein